MDGQLTHSTIQLGLSDDPKSYSADVWMLHHTCGRQEVLGSGGKKWMMAPLSSAIIRQDSLEEVRNHHPIWSVPPVLAEYSFFFYFLLNSTSVETAHSWLKPVHQCVLWSVCAPAITDKSYGSSLWFGSITLINWRHLHSEAAKERPTEEKSLC